MLENSITKHDWLTSHLNHCDIFETMAAKSAIVFITHNKPQVLFVRIDCHDLMGNIVSKQAILLKPGTN
ncbi:MAG: hypothetical protein CMG78_12095 [Marinobacter sp.]|nr:hypothetical protein [Marinobacter sp.]